MASVNKVILLGRLGQDPELNYTPSGQPVCKLRLATSETWNDSDGNKHEATEWHSIVAWGKTAEHCAKYLAKGREVYIEGKLKTRSWDDKATGAKRYATEIQAMQVVFLGGGQQQNAAQQGGQGTARESFQSGYQGQGGQQHATPPASAARTSTMDEIPF